MTIEKIMLFVMTFVSGMGMTFLAERTNMLPETCQIMSDVFKK